MLAADLRGIALRETAEVGWAASLRGSQPPRKSRRDNVRERSVS